VGWVQSTGEPHEGSKDTPRRGAVSLLNKSRLAQAIISPKSTILTRQYRHVVQAINLNDIESDVIQATKIAGNWRLAAWMQQSSHVVDPLRA
jgi:hypothetical protein